MTITANPYIFSILLLGVACFGVWIAYLISRPKAARLDPYEAEHKPPPAKTYILCDFIENKEN